MNREPLVSILINNYNYARFLPDAIESALGQAYPRTEVIVVDDGSTDDSRQVIARYGDRIVPVIKENGGQGSAYNAGFAASRGEVICLLDADDVFLPGKVEAVVRFLLDRRVLAEDVLVFHDLRFVDGRGCAVAMPKRIRRQANGDNYYELAKALGYARYPTYQPSGVTLTRSLAARIFPVPEGFPSGGDMFLIKAAGLLGRVYGMDTVLATYRIHGSNHWFGAGRMKSKAFYETDMCFSNATLVTNGLEPIVRTLDPWHLRGFYVEEARPRALLGLALREPPRDPDLTRWRFSAKTLYLAVLTAGRLAVRPLSTRVASVRREQPACP